MTQKYLSLHTKTASLRSIDHNYIYTPIPSLLCFITLYSSRATVWYAYSLLAPSDDEILLKMFQKVTTWRSGLTM